MVLALVVVCGGCWTQFRGGPAHTGVQPLETTIGRSNVSQLRSVWSGHTGTPASEPVVANGLAYVGALDHKLYAFDAAGRAGCTGSPVRCTARWTATLRSSAQSTPAVSDGVVYITAGVGTDSEDQPVDGTLYAFAAGGTTGCSGSPTVCTPLWTATLPGLSVEPPTVADGVVYVTTKDGGVAAFDARGVAGCSGSPKVCTPRWTARAGYSVWSAPTVADGVVYVGSLANRLYAFDARGEAGCTGTPRVCQPLWTAAMSERIYATPVVANGLVFAVSQDGRVVGLSASGTSGCSGSPKVCTPLWTASTEAVTSTPAVADGVLYLGSAEFRGGFHGTLYAFDATGAGHCSGSPLVCTPLWTAHYDDMITTSPTIANGVVYLSNPSGAGLDAYDARGTTGCSGTTKTCTPIASIPVGAATTPAVAGGAVFVGTADRHLTSLRLPT